jgi:hypothetical protein
VSSKQFRTIHDFARHRYDIELTCYCGHKAVLRVTPLVERFARELAGRSRSVTRRVQRPWSIRCAYERGGSLGGAANPVASTIQGKSNCCALAVEHIYPLLARIPVMLARTAIIGTTPSEQMFFGGAPLAHVVLYYDLQWRKRQARLREENKIRQHRQLIKCLAERHGADRPVAHLLGSHDLPG